MKGLTRLLSIVLLGLSCSTAGEPKDTRIKTYLELTTFVFEDKVSADAVTLGDILSGSYIRIEFRSDGTLQGKGLLGFSKWPGIQTPNNVPFRYWIYGKCVDQDCEIVVARDIAGWYETDSTGSVKLYLKQDEGKGSWLESFLYVYNEETKTLGFYYEDEYAKLVIEFTN